MSKVYAKYVNKNGEVVIFCDDGVFSVFTKKRKAPGFYNCCLQTVNNLEEACDAYNIGIEKLNNNNMLEIMCKANLNRIRRCSAKNCPKKFLGKNIYWRMFHNICLNRTK